MTNFQFAHYMQRVHCGKARDDIFCTTARDFLQLLSILVVE